MNLLITEASCRGVFAPKNNGPDKMKMINCGRKFLALMLKQEIESLPHG